ncbi:MAG: rhodanese-like domain-containing protein [Methylococcaceae bacterium]|nr:rhodanese-like domain-containing protein [Methylococcaceae bacterium]MDP3904745.1 rhodanese-like domain-containing protein [Methylococcaceae bacterium]
MIENLVPQQAWEVLQSNAGAVLVDVRSKVEHTFVGHPPGAIHIAWKEAPDWQVNNQFVADVKKVATNPSAPVLLLCRSGQRSLDAAKALENAGYQHLINIVDGFEGSLDANRHRGNLGGWRFVGLPWEQS